MNKLMISASALVLGLGISGAALAQDAAPMQQDKTTTTVQQPDGSVDKTTTKTSTSSDGYAQYRKTVTATKHYDAAAFQAPSGYTYSRLNVGDHVPAPLLGGGVTLQDYHSYALMAPPSGLTWIRNGQDALLIDQSTGEVVQADYGLFN